ncbi:MAG: hypothetical protein CML73_01230 [Rhodobiaceae bacterium]|nr:hypothetical protein [Rhodobiaceae bacterium]
MMILTHAIPDIVDYKKFKIQEKLKNEVWHFVNQHNIGNRFEFNGTKEQQFVGLIGEIMVKRLFGLDHKFKNGFDGGFDLVYKGLKIDVKTMGRNVDVKDYFVNNFVAHQSKFDCDIYIFCSLNKRKNELTVCGYLSKKELLKLAILHKKGDKRNRTNGTSFIMKTDNYEIENKKLKNIENLFYYLPKI